MTEHEGEVLLELVTVVGAELTGVTELVEIKVTLVSKTFLPGGCRVDTPVEVVGKEDCCEVHGAGTELLHLWSRKHL